MQLDVVDDAARPQPRRHLVDNTRVGSALRSRHHGRRGADDHDVGSTVVA
jgi:hypothetical protein